MHATDYVNMDLRSVDQKLLQNKKQDNYFSNKMQ